MWGSCVGQVRWKDPLGSYVGQSQIYESKLDDVQGNKKATLELKSENRDQQCVSSKQVLR